MFLKKLDEKRTYRNVQQFFKEDFDQLQRLSKAESLIATNDPSKAMSGSHKDNDSLNINHYSYKQLYDVCLKAIKSCSTPGEAILIKKYIDGYSIVKIAMDLGISTATYKRWLNKAYIEFADKLFEITSWQNPKHPIDFRIYEGD